MTDRNEVIGRPGQDALWLWFGLSYASWVTMPRVLMHAMSDDWQQRMAELLTEWDEAWEMPDTGTRVQVTVNGKLVKTPPDLLAYRHPSQEFIESLRRRRSTEDGE